MYQIEYVILKAANSPRPAAWVLERSIDGEHYEPWQFYASSDEDCWTKYSMQPVLGRPSYTRDDEVICTSYYSRQTPMENGEVLKKKINKYKRRLFESFFGDFHFSVYRVPFFFYSSSGVYSSRGIKSPPLGKCTPGLFGPL